MCSCSDNLGRRAIREYVLTSEAARLHTACVYCMCILHVYIACVYIAHAHHSLAEVTINNKYEQHFN